MSMHSAKPPLPVMAHPQDASIDYHAFTDKSPDARNDAATSMRSNPYRRNYRACDLCRRKKIRCDLGDLRDPQPPCAKCKREKRDCILAPGPSGRDGKTRQRKVHLASPLPSTQERGGSVTPQRPQQYESNGTRITAPTLSPSPTILRRARVGESAGSVSGNQPDLLSSGSGSSRAQDPVPRSLLETVLRDDTDALDLLFNAVSDCAREADQLSAQDGQQAPWAQSVPRAQEPAGIPPSNGATAPESGVQNMAVFGTNADGGLLGRLPTLGPEQVALWSRFPPCSQQFLSPAEVVAYLEYFYTVLNRQMPILSDCFQETANHQALLTEESVLCYAILTVSSRFFILPGYNGRSRGYLLHDHFFRYVQEAVQGLLWGYPLARGNGMTSMGAIESLLLLTQWPPRGLNMQTSLFDLSRAATAPHDTPSRLGDDQHGIAGPSAMTVALRSDTMCWRLTNLAVTLAFEGGLLKENHRAANETTIHSRSDSRRTHTLKILYIYASNLSTRLKRPNPLENIPVPHLKQLVASSTATQPEGLRSEWPAILNGWLDLVELGHIATQALYSLPANASDKVNDGRHDSMVDHFAKSVSHWWAGFQSMNMPKPFYCNMEVMYHYSMTLVYSVGLQPLLKPPSHEIPWQLDGIDLQKTKWYSMLREVKHSCCKVFAVIIEMQRIQALRTVPIPMLMRLVTMCMFGLKVVASSETKNGDLLTLLLRAISALRQSAVDDLHPAGHYAQLLECLADKAKHRSRASSGGPADSADAIPPNDIDHLEQLRNGAAPAYHEHSLGPSIGTNAPDDWDDWLAFGFDSTLASIGDMGLEEHFQYSDACGSSGLPGFAANGLGFA